MKYIKAITLTIKNKSKTSIYISIIENYMKLKEFQCGYTWYINDAKEYDILGLKIFSDIKDYPDMICDNIKDLLGVL